MAATEDRHTDCQKPRSRPTPCGVGAGHVIVADAQPATPRPPRSTAPPSPAFRTSDDAIGPGADYTSASAALSLAVTAAHPRRPDAAAIMRRIADRDLAAHGAVAPPAHHPPCPDVAADNARVHDIDYSVAHTHEAALRRRERKRLAELLQTAVRTDGTCRSLRDPLWSSLPPGTPPLSLHPNAMWAANPCPRTIFTGLQQHPSVVSSKVDNWRTLHAVHCAKCRRFSRRLHGHPPPPELATAFEPGWSPPSAAWSLDPSCYVTEQCADLFAGYDPQPLYEPAPRRIANSGSFWDNWGPGVTYLQKMEALGTAHSRPVWTPPADAVISALAVVVRPSDLRRHHMDATCPLPARTVQDITGSGGNDAFPDAPFRMAGIDHCVSLLFEQPGCHIGSLDLSKYFPSLPAGPLLQRILWVKDPRSDTTWRGSGPPSPEWRAFRHASRHRPRLPPYFRSVGLPLGFKLAPFFASCISAEMTQILNAVLVRSMMYIDDAFVVGRTAADCARAMAVAAMVFRFLGFKCADAKQQGPTRSLVFLGYVLDLDRGTVGIGADRRAHITQDLERIVKLGRVATDDLESLLGRLCFVATVMTGAGAFTYRLRRLFLNAKRCRRRTSLLTAAAALDAQWWLRHLCDPDWPGSRVFYTQHPIPTITLKSDASGTWGYGYVHDGALYFSRFSEAAAEAYHIGCQELEALAHFVVEHGRSLTGLVIRAGVDNAGVVHAVLKGTSSCPIMMRLLRIIGDALVLHRFALIAVHTKRRFNELADLCSRFVQVAEFNEDGVLPVGVVADASLASLRRCQHDSPLTNEPVYSLTLELRAGPT